MPSIRKTKTESGAIAVQVVRYENRKVVVLKHVGSGQTDKEVKTLIKSASIWIEKETNQTSLFPDKTSRILSLTTTEYLGVNHIFTYDILTQIAEQCGFDSNQDRFLLDFSFMRLVEPTSKLRTIELLKRYFSINYAERSVYRDLPKLIERKMAVEKVAIACATNIMQSDLSLVLYDVTTLYFETFDTDELRVQGFSKDNKSQQPQVVVGLLVNQAGFPLGYEVFAGNTFEGKTMIPVLEAFAEKYNVVVPTVVADAAMLSHTNITELTSRKLSYVVGARLANCSPKIIKEVSTALASKDGQTVRLATKHGDLIVSFSAKRFRKNKADMEKQIAKGKLLVERKEPGRRAKFVKRAGKSDAYVLNKELIEKTKLLLGVKGYYTNIPQEKLSNREVIDRYHDLWHVEQSFRMAKSDLLTRPIFHHKEDAIKSHLLICFVALVIGKYLEIQTGLSIKKIMDNLLSVTDAKMKDATTNEVFTFRSPVSSEVKSILKKLGVSY